ncbi:COG5511 Bacteriophage capsid protein [uncultured Caudovirales phage]|uniref:COG5511 Bacteriophage capsid protein n=1 Tax=uncultured Caudovirales phage TaxID=2100421 RepID=A0A6J5NZE8_9CAUD|nr:COG5511 Bacteriophage capsid protein [uncultured Caudovirales phage]
MAKKQPTQVIKPGADTPKLQKKAGATQFSSVSMSSNRAVIYGTAVDFSTDYTPSDRIEMIKRLRYGERNCGLIRQILNDYVTYVVGDQITPQSHCKDQAKADQYEAYFKQASKTLDSSGRFGWGEILRIVLRGALRDGDSFVVLVNDQDGKAKLQLLEGHRIGNPEGQEVPKGMLDGVSFDAQGRIKSYNVLQGDRTNRTIPAASVCQVCEYDYSSGSRGLPLLQHSWTDIQSEDDLLKLEMLAVRNDTDVTRVLKKQGGFIPTDMASELSGSTGGSLDAVASRMGGKLVALEPGEDLVSLESKRPNGNFVKFLEAIQRDISRGTGLPYEFSGDSSSVGGAALRLVNARADRAFNRWQTILIDRLCIPTWNWVIGSAIANGDLPDSPDWFNVSWTTPKRLTVDAGRDAAQERADIELGLLSLSEAYSARGLDFKQEAIKRAQDFKYLMALAEKEGLPLWTLYKPGFNWLQQGEGKPTATELQAKQMGLDGNDLSKETPETEDEPADQEEPESQDQPGS